MTAFAAFATAAALAVGLSFAAAGPALAAQPQAGQWKVVSKVTMTGLPPGVPAGLGQQENTQVQCVTPEMARDPKKWRTPDGGGNQNCSYKNNWNGNVLTIEGACTGNTPTTVKGAITFDSPTHYKGVMNSSVTAGGMAMQMTIAMEGQRVGECPK